MPVTELVSIAVCLSNAEDWNPPGEMSVRETSLGNPTLDRHCGELVRSMVGMPDRTACVVLRWRGGRVPVGIRIGGRAIRSAAGGRLMSGDAQIGVFRRTVDGGWDECSEHEMLVIVTNASCVDGLYRENGFVEPVAQPLRVGRLT